jgi:(S)-2-hydroxyglutarate dehydrogenase
MVSDFLIIGAGVIGINIAREIKRRYGDARVTVLDKEPACGKHASGRNSGVLHAGFYYTADSFKARFTRDGNRELTYYCIDRKLPINKCGKLVVAQTEDEVALLDELLARGRRNGVDLVSVSATEARAIEPRALTIERAIFSPTTSSIDPNAVVSAMENDARREGVQFRYSEAYRGCRKDAVFTSSGTQFAGYVINASGLYADQIARDFGFGNNYRILPFKGLYLYSEEPRGALRTNVYPVPDLRNPFLGVHFTVTVDGRAKIGPTAIPAFWREQYGGSENFSFSECMDIALRQLALVARSKFDFVRLAMTEMRKYSRSRMVDLAARLVAGVTKDQYLHWAKPGIRAQLVNTRTQKLEMDFVFEGDSRSFHVLNAVSPGFTCCLPFSRHVCDAIEAKIK